VRETGGTQGAAPISYFGGALDVGQPVRCCRMPRLVALKAGALHLANLTSEALEAINEGGNQTPSLSTM
jgi:hypothetical protein